MPKCFYCPLLPRAKFGLVLLWVRPSLHKESRLTLKKYFSICPKLVINAEHYGLVLAPRLKKGYHQIWEANLQPLWPMLQHLLLS
jgi:hypothetical protein